MLDRDVKERGNMTRGESRERGVSSMRCWSEPVGRRTKWLPDTDDVDTFQ
jgi:hypothetical protein